MTATEKEILEALEALRDTARAAAEGYAGKDGWREPQARWEALSDALGAVQKVLDRGRTTKG